MRKPAVSKRQYDLLIHEEARRNLPITTYLMLLDYAARTGTMPVLDPKTNKLVEGMTTELSVSQRIDVARYLIDKVLPDVPKEVYHIAQSSSEAEATPIDKLPGLSSEALRAIAEGTQSIQDATFTVTKPQ